ncbi:hypothetical protein LCGC14_1528770 [marine sediment metagenome]|uniref:Uncharacterized protein n=1 Tax=marine sediment metagenome TaxID=412755 RepID=A0A0F9IWU5_9ZZZZ
MLVYMSRHSEKSSYEDGYGAFIMWEVGESVKVARRLTTGPPLYATIVSETLTHESAPVVNGAGGQGRWVRELRFDGENELAAISEAQLEFDDRVHGEDAVIG